MEISSSSKYGRRYDREFKDRGMYSWIQSSRMAKIALSAKQRMADSTLLRRSAPKEFPESFSLANCNQSDKCS